MKDHPTQFEFVRNTVPEQTTAIIARPIILKPQLSAIDLFSGPGGLTLGLKSSGICPIGGVEFNRDAFATYCTHTPESEHYFGDVREVDFRRFSGSAEIVYGGPPCQPFSLGGKRQGKNDSRDMVPEFIRVVSEVRPEAFLMENVPGLLTRKYRSHFDKILFDLESLGYYCAWSILNAADYGVPQSRKRVFVVGMRERIFRFPAPTHGPTRDEPWITSSQILTSKPIGEPARSPVMYAPVVDLRPNPYHGHVFKGGGRPIDPNAPCQTLYASAGGNKTHWVDTENIVPAYHAHLKAGRKPKSGVVHGARRLSVEESALIQTFPPSLIFQGSKSSQYTQIGDAVPPTLAQALGEALVSQVLGKRSKRKLMPAEDSQRTLL